MPVQCTYIRFDESIKSYLRTILTTRRKYFWEKSNLPHWLGGNIFWQNQICFSQNSSLSFLHTFKIVWWFRIKSRKFQNPLKSLMKNIAKNSFFMDKAMIYFRIPNQNLDPLFMRLIRAHSVAKRDSMICWYIETTLSLCWVTRVLMSKLLVGRVEAASKEQEDHLRRREPSTRATRSVRLKTRTQIDIPDNMYRLSFTRRLV